MLTTILRTAQQIARHEARSSLGTQEAWRHFEFCMRHGYIGFPTSSTRQFTVGSYLNPDRGGYPNTPEEARNAIGIIVCFSDEVMPCEPVKIVTTEGTIATMSSYVSSRYNALVMGYVDWNTPFDLAMTFLHEIRHARHRFGRKLEGLPDLDPEQFHESRTWKYELSILDVLGGPLWQAAIDREADLLRDTYKNKGATPGNRFFATSKQSYSFPDSLFGNNIPSQSKAWDLRVGMRANFLLAEQAGIIDRDIAYANIVGRYHELAMKSK